jgi:hypothetical protein
MINVLVEEELYDEHFAQSWPRCVQRILKNVGKLGTGYQTPQFQSSASGLLGWQQCETGHPWSLRDLLLR